MELIKFVCESCGVSLKAPEAKSGKSFPCPKCKAVVTVPSLVVDETFADSAKSAAKMVKEKTGELIKSAPKASVVFGGATTFVCKACDERLPYTEGAASIPTCPSCGNVMSIGTTEKRRLRFGAAFLNLMLPGFEYLWRGKWGAFFTYWVLFIFSLGLTVITLGFASPLAMYIWVMPSGDALFRDWERWTGSFLTFLENAEKKNAKTASP